MKHKKGFTLVELLVVIAILAILATVSVVGYTSFIDRTNQSNAQTEAVQIEQVIKTALILDDKVYIKKAYNDYIICTRVGNDYAVSKSTTEPTDAKQITDIPEKLINGLKYVDVGGLIYTFEKDIEIVIKIPVPWESLPESEGLEFALNDGVSYYVKSIGTCTDTYIIIPSTYNDLPVTKIGLGAFNNCTSLTNIVIPDSVTSMDYGAFNNCTSLLSIKLSNSLTSISENAFDNCTSLTSIEIPNSVTSIGKFAFNNCTSLTSVNIPNSVTIIETDAFRGCTSLNSIEIPASVTSLSVEGNSSYAGAFKDCTSLANIEVDINNPVFKSIDGNLYTKDGSRLLRYGVAKEATSFTVPDSVTSIGKAAFRYCTSLESIVIPNSVTSIVASAFSDCTSLTSITFEGTVEQWNQIKKISPWNTNVPATEVICSDGVVSLK